MLKVSKDVNAHGKAARARCGAFRVADDKAHGRCERTRHNASTAAMVRRSAGRVPSRYSLTLFGRGSPPGEIRNKE